jgi:hypothetical protein
VGGDPDAANTMFFQGGDLRFGKLTMHGADLQLIDADPGDPFAYSLRNNLDQLSPGSRAPSPTTAWWSGCPTTMRSQVARTSPARRSSTRALNPLIPLGLSNTGTESASSSG